MLTGCSLKKDHQYRFINLPGKKKFAWTLSVDSGRRPHPDFTCGWQHLVKVSYKLQKCDQSHKWASPGWSTNLPMAGKVSTFWPCLKTLETLATLSVKIYVNKWWNLNKYGYRFSYTELFCVKWTTKRQRKRGETFFYTFCTISFLFPPLRPLSTECAEYAFHGQEALEPARTENREKRHKAGEKGRERERNVPSFSCTAI